MVERWLAEISSITSESAWYASVSHPLERIMEYDLDCRKDQQGRNCMSCSSRRRLSNSRES